MPPELAALLKLLAEGGPAAVLLALLIVENIVLARALQKRHIVLGWVYTAERAARLKSDTQAKRSGQRVRDLTDHITEHMRTAHDDPGYRIPGGRRGPS